MRRPIRDTLKVHFQILGGIVLFFFLLYVVPAGLGPGVGLLTGLCGLLLNGWALYAFLRYRQGRQEELLQVLTAAVESGMPLAPAVAAYVRDRPRPGEFRIVISIVICFLLPLYAYVRLWVGPQSYDRLLNRFLKRLQAGEALTDALAAVPRVASRATQLAAEVGESTGSLGLCLRTAGRARLTATWLEIAPQLIYPCLVFLFVSGITTFLMVVIIPKFMRIFDEFGFSFPTATQTLVDVATWGSEYWPLVQMGIWLLGLAIAAMIAVPGVRWHTPVIGRLYRWGLQADILRALGRFLAARQTVPYTLAALSDSVALPDVARRRLSAVAGATLSGEPLAESLRKQELLPPAMVPLVNAAQRANTLPWALDELADHLTNRAFHLVRRIMLVVSPLAIVAVGILVGFIAIGMFVPLIELMSSLGE